MRGRRGQGWSANYEFDDMQSVWVCLWRGGQRGDLIQIRLNEGAEWVECPMRWLTAWTSSVLSLLLLLLLMMMAECKPLAECTTVCVWVTVWVCVVVLWSVYSDLMALEHFSACHKEQTHINTHAHKHTGTHTHTPTHTHTGSQAVTHNKSSSGFSSAHRLLWPLSSALQNAWTEWPLAASRGGMPQGWRGCGNHWTTAQHPPPTNSYTLLTIAICASDVCRNYYN